MSDKVIGGWVELDAQTREEEAWRELEQRQAKTTDMVNHPPHYTRGSIECIDALAAATHDLKGLEAICTANAIKYLWRWKHKNGVEDLKKARWYIDKLIDRV